MGTNYEVKFFLIKVGLILKYFIINDGIEENGEELLLLIG